MHYENTSRSRVHAVVVLAIAWGLVSMSVVSNMATAKHAAAASSPLATTRFTPTAKIQIDPNAKRELDRSGRKRTGIASIYADYYSGKPMADGTPMQPTGNNAASITLPLGTTAKVTNLSTGRSAVVTIRDRGPYVPGRIIDLSPATALQIGLDRRQGLAKVEVAPLSIPLADGSVKVAPDVAATGSS